MHFFLRGIGVAKTPYLFCIFEIRYYETKITFSKCFLKQDLFIKLNNRFCHIIQQKNSWDFFIFPCSVCFFTRNSTGFCLFP